MNKREFQHLITLCGTTPVAMANIVIRNEKDKKEIVDMIEGCNCVLVDNEIRFKNGNVISMIEPKGNIIRDKRSEFRSFIDDFEKCTIEHEKLEDVYLVEDNELIKESKMCTVIKIRH